MCYGWEQLVEQDTFLLSQSPQAGEGTGRHGVQLSNRGARAGAV